MRAILFTLLSVVCVAAFSATVYKWVDENGVTHYSDQPHENAEKVTVAQPQTYPAPRQSARSNTSAQQPPRQARSTYTCSIVRPANEDTFPDATTIMTAAQASPPPHDGDKVILMYDGQTVGNFPPSGGAFQLNGVERGTHTLQAQVQDRTGNVLCQSSNVTFTVLQPSVLNPVNPNFHR
jgi:Domain of unknown function (DUF4124)